MRRQRAIRSYTHATTLLHPRPRNVIRIVFGAQLLFEGLAIDSNRHASGLHRGYEPVAGEFDLN